MGIVVFLLVWLYSGHSLKKFFYTSNLKYSLNNECTRINRRYYSNNNKKVVEEYVNPITELLGKFITTPQRNETFIRSIDWNKNKRPKTTLKKLIDNLSKDLKAKEWFVTGYVDVSYFSDDFKFEDPDVKVNGIQDYAIGVNKIFNQKLSRAEVIDITVNPLKSKNNNDVITVEWRLEGAVNIGPQPGLRIKPYIIFTDFEVSNKTGLILSQLDRFSLPGYDILLSSLLPFLQPFLSKPAPPIDEILANRKPK
eukprot:gene6415-8832_t